MKPTSAVFFRTQEHFQLIRYDTRFLCDSWASINAEGSVSLWKCS